jgi:RsiW-degrading membrane proteinase PrsW (M82 family)
MSAEYYRDAFWIGIGGAAALVGLHQLLDYVAGLWPTLHRGIPAAFGQVYDAVFPGIGSPGALAFRGLMAVGVLALGGAFLGAELRARWLRLSLFLAIAAAMVTNWGSPADFLKQFLVSAILLAVVVFGIQRLVRFNLLGLFLIVICTALLGIASELLGQPNGFYRLNGYVIVLIIVLLLAWPLVIWRQRGQAVQPAS